MDFWSESSYAASWYIAQHSVEIEASKFPLAVSEKVPSACESAKSRIDVDRHFVVIASELIGS